MKKIILLIVTLFCAGVVNAQTITITSVAYRATDSSVLVNFTVTGSLSGLTNYEYLLGPGGSWTTLSPSSTNLDSIRIPDANGYTQITIRTLGVSTQVTSNMITTAHPLPVTWLTVDAGHTENGNLVTWTTGSEKNNDYFLIETSPDAIIWNVISSKIEPKDTSGNNATLSSYDWTHLGNNVKMYYRVKQVDFDGKYDYSKVVYANKSTVNTSSILVTATEPMFFYPNPTSGELHVVGYANTNVIISDNTDRIVFHHVLTSAKEVLDIRDLSPGMYYVHMADRNRNNIVKKLIIE